jgi:hypothetical protein
VASAFDQDRQLLEAHQYKVDIELQHPGYIRGQVSKQGDTTKVEWAFDSSWRFMPVVFESDIGYMLDPVDLAINKILALAGRDEPRDYLDVIYTDKNILPLGAQIWAACGKDPGFSPDSLLELLKRRGRYHQEDFSRLHLSAPMDLRALKQQWLEALQSAESFLQLAPPEELGCLYYDRKEKKFVQPGFDKNADVVTHFGRPGGVLPLIKES